MKRLGLMIISAGVIFAGSRLAADQLDGDFLPEDDVKIEDYSKTDIPKGKSEALAAFSEYMLAQKPEQRMDKLLLTIDADPEAAVPLGCFIRELETVKDRKAYQTKLVELAERHPEALKVCMTAAYFLSMDKQQTRMVDLINSCLAATKFNRLDAKEVATISSIISLAARSYIQTERYAEGDEFFEKYLGEKVLAENLRFLAHALLFYNSAREKGKDEKGFWWFSESSKERYARLYTELLKKTEAACEKSVADPADIIPVLDVCRKNKSDTIGADILYRMLKTAPDDVKIRVFLAVYYDNCGMYEESLRVWREIIKKDPMQQRFSLELAKVAEKAGHFEIAAAAYRNFLLNNPSEDPLINGRLAMVCIRIGEFQEAIEVLSPMKDHPMAQYISSIAYRQLKNYNKALEMMQLCEVSAARMKLNGLLDDGFYRNMAFICERAGKIDKAELILKKQLAKNPNDPVTANCLGYILADNNINLPEAARLIREALEKMPDNAAIVDSMAWVLYRQGKYADAGRFIEQALKMAGKIPDAVVAEHAGDIYLALKQKEKALEYWRIALRTYSPEDDINRKKLQEKITAQSVTAP